MERGSHSLIQDEFYTVLFYPLLCTLGMSVLFELVARNIGILHS